MYNTNNGTERVNEDLKYDELVGHKNCTLNKLLQVLSENFKTILSLMEQPKIPKRT